MAETTNISWCDSTFNPWTGCEAVSQACEGCYAWARDKRFGGGHFGTGSPRQIMSKENWRKPLKWNEAAIQTGRQVRVFCSSLADVFDKFAPDGQRERLWKLIYATPALTWLLLTKRPGNIAKMMPPDLVNAPNIWLGTTTENQKEADRRIPVLLRNAAPVHFISAEPLFERIDVEMYLGPSAINWVIAGGGSDQALMNFVAPPMPPEWVYDLHAQCSRASVPFFFKQIGSNHTGWHGIHQYKGEDPAEWPADLRIQQFPPDTHPASRRRQEALI